MTHAALVSDGLFWFLVFRPRALASAMATAAPSLPVARSVPPTKGS